MANQSRHTGALTAQTPSNTQLTWDEATFTENQAEGIWDNPFAAATQARNTGTLTSQTKH